MSADQGPGVLVGLGDSHEEPHRAPLEQGLASLGEGGSCGDAKTERLIIECKVASCRLRAR